MGAMWFYAITFLMTMSLPKVLTHGSMVKPINWFDKKIPIWIAEGYEYDYVGMKAGLTCLPGCYLPTEKLCPRDPTRCNNYNHLPGCACNWFTNNTFIGKPTLFDPKLRTYPKGFDQEKILHHPWRAPGFASIDSPCGVAGGNYRGCVGGCNHAQGGYGGGSKAEKMDFGHKIVVTNWTRGDVVEAAWGIYANHGGGYSYRLCKVPSQGMTRLTEECFQNTPLEFVGDVQWVQYGEAEDSRIEFPAIRVNQGTFPEGSQWTRNPIPACIGVLGGALETKPGCSKGPQFPPPRPLLMGFGTNSAIDKNFFQFSIVDKIKIPKNLEPGDYVLSFRWDSEQTAQVWNTCASINLH